MANAKEKTALSVSNSRQNKNEYNLQQVVFSNRIFAPPFRLDIFALFMCLTRIA